MAKIPAQITTFPGLTEHISAYEVGRPWVLFNPVDAMTMVDENTHPKDHIEVIKQFARLLKRLRTDYPQAEVGVFFGHVRSKVHKDYFVPLRTKATILFRDYSGDMGVYGNYARLRRDGQGQSLHVNPPPMARFMGTPLAQVDVMMTTKGQITKLGLLNYHEGSNTPVID